MGSPFGEILKKIKFIKCSNLCKKCSLLQKLHKPTKFQKNRMYLSKTDIFTAKKEKKKHILFYNKLPQCIITLADL